MHTVKKWFIAALCVVSFTAPLLAKANDDVPETIYARAKVIAITEQGERDEAGIRDAYQVVLLEVLSGPDAGETVATEYVTSATLFRHQELHVRDTVVISKVGADAGTYYVVDIFRLPAVAVCLVLFFLAAAFFGRRKGVGALLGLALSLGILLFFVVPKIFAGGNPLVISLIGSVMIAIVSIISAHGIERRTFVALAATLLTLFAAFILSAIAVAFAGLSGGGTEEAMFLQLNYLTDIDLQGLLLGGMVIGALGVLDDVTTAQVAAIEEIHKADPSLNFKELSLRGMSVGREHIASLVNTLALAYVGASFPIFLLFAIPDGPPLWALLNMEQIVEEVVRALVGGGALMLAVPISTFLAAWFFSKQKYV